MCGRFSLFLPEPEVEQRFEAVATEPILPRYNIAPGDDVAVIRDANPAEIDQLEWGLYPNWVDDPDDWPAPINARAETIDEKPSFTEAAERRRCLVLADGYYEWTGPRRARQPYRICLPDDRPFAFAGLWETWCSKGADRRTATIITTDANETIAPLNDRMPAVLSPEEERAWFEADDVQTRRDLLEPYPHHDGLEAYPVSRAVNDPANDTPAVLEPAAIGEQSGLGDFE